MSTYFGSDTPATSGPLVEEGEERARLETTRRSGGLDQGDALDVVRHREDVKAAERGRDPLRPTAIIVPKSPLTCGDADFFA
jgi:hypothetical protein